jgi:uncharacterized protein (DUF1800 family)
MKTLVRTLVAAICATATLAASAPRSAVPSNPDDKTILHVLNRIGFGARPGDIDRVRQIGLAAYIDQQLHPERIPDAQLATRLTEFETLNKNSREIAQEYYLPAQIARQRAQAARKNSPAPQNGAGDATSTASGSAPDNPNAPRTPEERQLARKARAPLVELSEQKIIRAAYSDRQLEEVMTDFWFNHFNVFAGKGATQEYLTAYERDVIRRHALGKFRDLLGATAKSPAMLFYLDNWQSIDPNGPHPVNGQYGRPFGRGVLVGPGIRPGAPFPMPSAPQGQQARAQQQRRGLNENYGRELMELHTLGVDGGYTQADVINVARSFTGWTIDQPRQGGAFRFEPRFHDEGVKLVLGHRIKAGGGEKDGEQVLDILAKHPSTAKFISTKLVRRFVSDTPPPALVDRAAARFTETDGDIREVLRTILTSPEFFAADAYRAKVKTPFEFVVSSIRATGSNVTDATALVQNVAQLGEPLYRCQPPTGYADKAEAWVNTGALLNRMNFALALVSGRMRGVEPGDAPVNAALANDISTSTAATIAKATEPQQVAALTLGSPEFQRR